MRKPFVFMIVILLSLIGTACTAVVQAPASGENRTPTNTAESGTAGNMAGMDHSGMTMDNDIPFDAQFIDSMIEHHQGAIIMAQEVLEKSERPELRTLADAIIVAQTGEIAEMQAWRKAWYPDLPPTAGMGIGMGDMQIADDPNKSFEQRFIEAMISHHEGAIDMARMALQMSERDEIHTLAEAIIAAQTVEIEMMQGWLEE